MRSVIIVSLLLLTYSSLAVEVAAQQTESKKVVVRTMINERTGDQIEFWHGNCEKNESDTDMTCDFHIGLILHPEHDSCGVLTMGYRAVLHSRGRGAWESDPSPPDEICGASAVITLQSTTVSGIWTMTRRNSAPTRDADSSFCRKVPREETFTVFGKRNLKCRVLRPAGP